MNDGPAALPCGSLRRAGLTAWRSSRPTCRCLPRTRSVNWCGPRFDAGAAIAPDAAARVRMRCACACRRRSGASSVPAASRAHSAAGVHRARAPRPSSASRALPSMSTSRRTLRARGARRQRYSFLARRRQDRVERDRQFAHAAQHGGACRHRAARQTQPRQAREQQLERCRQARPAPGARLSRSAACRRRSPGAARGARRSKVAGPCTAPRPSREGRTPNSTQESGGMVTPPISAPVSV